MNEFGVTVAYFQITPVQLAIYLSIYLSEPRKKPQCIVSVRELYYITFAKEKCWVAKDRESNLLRERSRKRSLRYFKLFVWFSRNGPVGMDGKLAQEV